MDVSNTENDWISLTDYSTEYGVSVSTLRRRIKTNQIKYKQLHGKYYLPRQPLPPQSQAFTPVPAKEVTGTKVGKVVKEDPASKSLLDELKGAYRQTLQGREDQIIQLKQQISDLKTLVMYLERENTRLKNN